MSGGLKISKINLVNDTASVPASNTIYKKSDNILYYTPDGIKEIKVSQAKDQDVARLTGSTYGTIQDLQNIYHSAGWVSGGVITDAGSGQINVTAGKGLIRATDNNADTIYFFDWSAISGQSLTDNDLNYVYVYYDGVEINPPTIQVSLSDVPNLHQYVRLGTVYRSGTTLTIDGYSKTHVSDHASLMVERTIKLNGLSRESGALITAGGTSQFNVSGGVFWKGLTQFNTAAFTAGSNFTYFYGNTTFVTATAININQYDNAGTLTDLSNNKYGNHWVYITPWNGIYVKYGTGDYTLSEAQAASPPVTLPEILTYNRSVLIGKIIVQKGVTTFTEISSAFVRTFQYTNISGGGGATTFLELTDTPGSFTANKLIGANAGATALEPKNIFFSDPIGQEDAAIYSRGYYVNLDQANKPYFWNGETHTDLTAGGGTTTFTGLTDTPANYTSASNKITKVNNAATALEYSNVIINTNDIFSGTKGVILTARTPETDTSNNQLFIDDDNVLCFRNSSGGIYNIQASPSNPLVAPTLSSVTNLGTVDSTGYVTNYTGGNNWNKCYYVNSVIDKTKDQVITFKMDTARDWNWQLIGLYAAANEASISGAHFAIFPANGTYAFYGTRYISSTQYEEYNASPTPTAVNYVSGSIPTGSCSTGDFISCLFEGSSGAPYTIHWFWHQANGTRLAYGTRTVPSAWNSLEARFYLGEHGTVPNTISISPTALPLTAFSDVVPGVEYLYQSTTGTFTGLLDTPRTITANKLIGGNSGGTALEAKDIFFSGPITQATAATYTRGYYVNSDQSNKPYFWNGSTHTDLSATGGSTTFTGLSDTPANYTSASNKIAKVNNAATALEYSNITINTSDIITSARGVTMTTGADPAVNNTLFVNSSDSNKLYWRNSSSVSQPISLGTSLTQTAGSWTPVVSFTSGGLTGTNHSGYYVKQGNMVNLFCSLIWTGLSAPTGTMYVTGFPDNPSTAYNRHYPGAFNFTYGLNNPTDGQIPAVEMRSDVPPLRIQFWWNNYDTAPFPPTIDGNHLLTAGDIRFSIAYYCV